MRPELTDFFEQTVKAGIDTVWISGFRFRSMTPEDQQAVVTRADRAGLKTLGFIDGAEDWPEQRGWVEKHYQVLLDQLRALKLGRLHIAFSTDVEPYTKQDATGKRSWNGDLAGYMTLLEGTVLPQIRTFAKSTRHPDGQDLVRAPLLTRFEPFWYKNGQRTDGGVTIRGLRPLADTAVAGMTYRDTGPSILGSAEILRQRAAGEQMSFQIGVETMPADQVGTPSFSHKEAQIGPALLEAYRGMSSADQGRLNGVYIHTQAPVVAHRIVKILLNAPAPSTRAPSGSSPVAQPAKALGVVGGHTTAFTDTEMSLTLQLPKPLLDLAQQGRLIAFGVTNTDRLYPQPYADGSVTFPVASGGHVTVTTVATRPFRGQRAGRAVILVTKDDVAAYFKQYGQGASVLSVGGLVRGIVVIDDQGQATVVESYRAGQAGLEEVAEAKQLVPHINTWLGTLPVLPDGRRCEVELGSPDQEDFIERYGSSSREGFRIRDTSVDVLGLVRELAYGVAKLQGESEGIPAIVSRRRKLTSELVTVLDQALPAMGLATQMAKAEEGVWTEAQIPEAVTAMIQAMAEYGGVQEQDREALRERITAFLQFWIHQIRPGEGPSDFGIEEWSVSGNGRARSDLLYDVILTFSATTRRLSGSASTQPMRARWDSTTKTLVVRKADGRREVIFDSRSAGMEEPVTRRRFMNIAAGSLLGATGSAAIAQNRLGFGTAFKSPPQPIDYSTPEQDADLPTVGPPRVFRLGVPQEKMDETHVSFLNGNRKLGLVWLSHTTPNWPADKIPSIPVPFHLPISRSQYDLVEFEIVSAEHIIHLDVKFLNEAGEPLGWRTRQGELGRVFLSRDRNFLGSHRVRISIWPSDHDPISGMAFQAYGDGEGQPTLIVSSHVEGVRSEAFEKIRAYRPEGNLPQIMQWALAGGAASAAVAALATQPRSSKEEGSRSAGMEERRTGSAIRPALLLPLAMLGIGAFTKPVEPPLTAVVTTEIVSAPLPQSNAVMSAEKVEPLIAEPTTVTKTAIQPLAAVMREVLVAQSFTPAEAMQKYPQLQGRIPVQAERVVVTAGLRWFATADALQSPNFTSVVNQAHQNPEFKDLEVAQFAGAQDVQEIGSVLFVIGQPPKDLPGHVLVIDLSQPATFFNILQQYLPKLLPDGQAGQVLSVVHLDEQHLAWSV